MNAAPEAVPNELPARPLPAPPDREPVRAHPNCPPDVAMLIAQLKRDVVAYDD